MPFKKSHIKFYADECFPVTSVTFLRSLGYSIVHAFDLRYIRKSDLYHLKASKKLKRILITLDRDFLYYNKANLDNHPGIIVISLSSMTPDNVNKVCRKLFQHLNLNTIKESVIKCTSYKFIKEKQGKVILDRRF